MENQSKKSYGLLLAGVILLAVGIFLAVVTYRNSYQESVRTGEALSELKEQIQAVQEGTAQGDLEAMNQEADALSDQKLKEERPYSYSLILVFAAVLFTAKGICNALFGVKGRDKPDIRRLAMAGLLAALCYIGFAFFKIDIYVGPERTSFHFGNVFCVLAALLLGGYWGGLAGAIGMTIGDLTTAYVTSAPKTFLLKLCIGLIVGLVGHTLLKLSKDHSPKYVLGATIAASAAGMAFNIVADPLAGYFYKTYLLGIPQNIASALAKLATVTTAVNAVIAVFAATVIYLALRPALRKAGLFPEV